MLITWQMLHGICSHTMQHKLVCGSGQWAGSHYWALGQQASGVPVAPSESGQRGSRQWVADTGQRAPGTGNRAVGSGQWAVGGGQWGSGVLYSKRRAPGIGHRAPGSRQWPASKG